MTTYRPKPCEHCPHSLIAHYTRANERELQIVCAVCQNSGVSSPCRVIPLTAGLGREGKEA